MSTTHNFERSLAYSHDHADAPWWTLVYQAAFGQLLSCVSVRKDGWAQRSGIDRIVITEHGRRITVDEKVRSADWPDFLLERFSDEGRRTAGWIQKPLDCDFIAYAFVPSETCYLLPTITLQRAWQLHGREWVKVYPEKRAYNEDRGRSWVTLSTAVPRDVLLLAMTDAMTICWGK